MEEEEEKIFWDNVKVQLKCQFPTHLQKVLSRTGYLNPAFAELTVTQIDKVQTDIRGLPELINLPPGHPDIKAMCGNYVNSCKDFSIMTGERALLLKLASIVKTKGWSFFTKSRRGGNAGSTRVDEQDEMALRRKLSDTPSTAMYYDKPEVTFSFKVENLSKLTDSVLSPAYYVRNLPWKIMVMRRTNDTTSPPSKGLGFFLQCNGESDTANWSCSASAELRLLSVNPNRDPFERKIRHVFNRVENDWGFSFFINWNDVLNPKNGYIRNDAITLEVHVTVEHIAMSACA